MIFFKKGYLYPMQDKILHIQEKHWNRKQGVNAGTMCCWTLYLEIEAMRRFKPKVPTQNHSMKLGAGKIFQPVADCRDWETTGLWIALKHVHVTQEGTEHLTEVRFVTSY